MEDIKNEKTAHYLEFIYPHVICDDDVIVEFEKNEYFRTLTPLERAFLGWYLFTRSPQISFTSLIHPAHYFDVNIINSAAVFNRPTMREAVKKAFELNLFEKLYTRNYLFTILHDEISRCRARNRKIRFDDERYIMTKCTGKKSIHEEELMESELMLKCLNIIMDLKKTPDEQPSSSEADKSSETRSYDRLFSEVQTFVNGPKAIDS